MDELMESENIDEILDPDRKKTQNNGVQETTQVKPNTEIIESSNIKKDDSIQQVAKDLNKKPTTVEPTST